MTHNKGMPWTTPEDEYLRRWYAEQSVAKTAAELGRTPQSVRIRAHQLGIGKRPKPKGGKHPWWR